MAGAGRMYEVRARTSFTSALALARVFASGSEGEPSQILPPLKSPCARRQDGAYLHYPGRRAPPDPGRRNMRVMQAALVAAVAAVPTVGFAPGVHMPMISLGAGHTRGTPLPTPCLTAQRPLSTCTACLSGTWQYNSSLAESVVSLGLKLGFTHIDTANDYKNQDGVGRALVRATTAAAATAATPLLALALALNHLRTRPPTRP